MAKQVGPRPKYSRISPRGVVMALDGHRVVRDPLQLKFGLERFAGVRDGRERWLSIRRETLRDDLIIHKLDQQLLNEAALAKLVGRMPPYVTARYTR